jgi:hypothetical protein
MRGRGQCLIGKIFGALAADAARHNGNEEHTLLRTVSVRSVCDAGWTGGAGKCASLQSRLGWYQPCVSLQVPMRFTAVKLRRLERHLLQIEVAKRAAVACSRLSAIESGEVEAQPEELQRIAAALDISAQELQGGCARYRVPMSTTENVVALLRPVAARPIAS